MPTYSIDHTRFQGEGALISWDVAARRLGVTSPLAGAPTLGAVVELRWILRADCGLPTEPFVVWSRPHSNQQVFQPLVTQSISLGLFGGLEMVTWTAGAVSMVSLDLTVTANGMVVAFAGAPIIGNVVGFQSVSPGNTTITISAKLITSVTLPQGVTLNAARGVVPGGYANAPGWTKVEIVGLPVARGDWAGVGNWGGAQGMVTALTDGQTAAQQRLDRGAPRVGWAPTLTAGVGAPPWKKPDNAHLVADLNADLLKYLHDITRDIPPSSQADQKVSVPLPPPQNSAGKFTNKPGTTTTMQPLPMTLMAASTDPYLSLALGFGTAYDLIAPGFRAGDMPVNDYMVTAHWEKGIDGESGSIDMAVVIPSPGLAPAPPPPANLGTEVIGALRPPHVDEDWRESVRVNWDRPAIPQLFRIASCAAARASLAPAGATEALMEKRAAGGLRPIIINAPLDSPEPLDPQWFRVHVVDREIDIPSSPGSRQMKYGAALQDIYGQWSSWASVDALVQQPALDPIRLGAAKLAPNAPVSGSICQTSFEIDIFWDWRIRSPKTISLRGKLFAASAHGDPAPAFPVPAGFDRSLAGGGAAITITFAGGTPTASDGVLTPITEDGDTQAASFGPAQGTNRRYRLKIDSLLLDFGSTPFIGLVIWAQGQEAIAPNRVTPWQDHPVVISTGDPRPPVVPVHHVLLGSIPDAAGCSHVQISWTAQLTATGYFIYEATEASLLQEWLLPEPNQKDTLDARLTGIRTNFPLNPVRRPFTRWNSRALTGTSTDIALPKGSTGIHVFIVLGISAGQVESDWPTSADAIIPIAAPHITKPAPPMIEAWQVIDSSVMPPVYKAQLKVTTRPGPRPAKVELYRVRVDDAAREVDTMGPPIAQLSATSGSWIVETAPDAAYGPYIASVNGTDAPAGSWRRVWYRATCWTGRDETRGGLPGRSEASNAAWVVLPPSDPPVVSALSVGAGPTAADVIIQWTCASPRKRTPLGPHKISVRAAVSGAAGPALISLDGTLDNLPSAQPATGSGVWVTGTAAGVTTYRALIRRAAASDVVSFAVRITDPLGRTGAQLLTVDAGSPVIAPDLSNLHAGFIPFPPPGHTILTFTSASPLIPPLDGPYVVRVTGIRLVPGFFPPPPSVTMPLGSVPTRAPMPPPAFYILRTPGGPPCTYTVVSTIRLHGFVVRITAPDGTFTEKSI